MRREVVLVQRTLFIYYFKTAQILIMVSPPSWPAYAAGVGKHMCLPISCQN